MLRCDDDSNTCCTVCGLPTHSFQVVHTTWEEQRDQQYIQAIVGEHYERYMDQEEEYEREHLLDSDSNLVTSVSD